jgi:hypothetical protein
MIVHRFGAVILTKGKVQVEGWNIEREPDKDPADATDEQLLLGYAVNWALETLKAELKKTAYDVFRNMVKRN